MANYNCVIRTNYFRVIDEERYEELFGNLHGDIIDFTKEDRKGNILHGFGSYTDIFYMFNDDMELFYTELQKILPDDEAFILIEVGHVKLRYICGYADIITNKNMESISLEDLAALKASELLDSEDFATSLNY